MAHFKISFYSETLGQMTHVNAILPDGKNAPYRTLYLLHGLSDNENAWEANVPVERYVKEYGLAVIMPDASKSFYTDSVKGDRYYTYISKELPEKVRQWFPLSQKREDNFLMGNSMGGYGSLKLCLREHESFCAAAALSPCTDVSIRRMEAVMVPVFGEDFNIRPEDDLFSLTEKFPVDAEKPRIFMAIGTEDFLYEEAVRLRNCLSNNEFPIEYREEHGDHTWSFWDKYFREGLKWMLCGE